VSTDDSKLVSQVYNDSCVFRDNFPLLLSFCIRDSYQVDLDGVHLTVLAFRIVALEAKFIVDEGLSVCQEGPFFTSAYLQTLPQLLPLLLLLLRRRDFAILTDVVHRSPLSSHAG